MPERLGKGLLALLLLIAAVVVGACGNDDNPEGDLISFQGKDAAQTISFQEPEEPGPDPFTEPTDVKGDDVVELPEGQGPYGGTGSDRVCDRDLLIRTLRKHPDRMREWARVLGISPTFKAVSRYIAKLHPVTLTRDTQVTNHSFVNGRAVAFQAILQAGTAVLVDKYGRPVARCRCGNPLLEPIYVKTARCLGCPDNYRPPRACDFYGRRRDYDRTYYRRDYYSNGDYDEVFVRQHRRSGFAECYQPYPDPPVVRIVRVFKVPKVRKPPPAATPAGGLQCDPPRSQLEFEQCQGVPQDDIRDNGPPQASITPSSGSVHDTYTLTVGGFEPNRTLEVSVIRPDGNVDKFSMTTGADGSNSFTFPTVDNRLTGTYTITVRDPSTGENAQTSTTVHG